MEELDAGVRTQTREREELRQASVSLQKETHKLRVQNEELQHKVTRSPAPALLTAL